MAAVSILLLAALVGSGVDLSRAYRAKNRLQAACDAAVLAGRRAETDKGFDATARTQAVNFFTANFDDDRQDTGGTSFEPYSDDDGETVKATARTTSPNMIMKMFGFAQVDLDVECQASMGVGNSDVIMVLDTTGSMEYDMAGSTKNYYRINSLRTAMKNFYNTLNTATTGTNARIRYGFVPYSSAVNVGQVLLDTNPDYLADNWTYQTRDPAYRDVQVFDRWGNEVSYPGSGSSTSAETATSNWVNTSNTTYNSSNCNNGLPSPTSWTNSGSPTSASSVSESNGKRITTYTSTQRQTRTNYQCYKSTNSNSSYVRQSRGEQRYVTTTTSYGVQDPIYRTEKVFDHWDYYARSRDTSVFKTFTTVSSLIGESGGQPANLNSRWTGCVQEPNTVNASSFSYSSVTGLTPEGAQDLDIDHIPGASDTSRWGPMWPQMSYQRKRSSNGNWYLTTANTTVGDPVTGTNSTWWPCPSASKLLSEMTKGDFDAYADGLTTSGGTYLDIGIAWGGRFLSPDGIFADLVNEAPDNGAEVSRHIIFMTDGDMAPNLNTYTSYGMEYFDRKTTPDGVNYGNLLTSGLHSNSDDTARHSSRFRAVCRSIKAKGIRIWTISFKSGTASSDLAACASDNSSFNASNATQLNAAFQEIAKQVGELRIVQ